LESASDLAGALTSLDPSDTPAGFSKKENKRIIDGKMEGEKETGKRKGSIRSGMLKQFLQ